MRSSYHFFGVLVKGGVLGEVEESGGVRLVGDQVGFDFSFRVVLFGFLHYFEQFPVVLNFIIFDFFADEQEGDVKDAPVACQDDLLPVALAHVPPHLETGPVATFQLVVGPIDCLAVNYPVYCADHPLHIHVFFLPLLEFVVQVVLVFLSEGVQVGPHENSDLFQLSTAHHIQTLNFLLLIWEDIYCGLN